MRPALPVALMAALLGSASFLVGVRVGADQSTDIEQAQRWAQRMQDDARVLRNGARAGAGVAQLEREHDRLRNDLKGLVEAHERWGLALEPGERSRVAERLAAVAAGCERIHTDLGRLDAALADRKIDRRRIQELGQAIGRQSGICERELRGAKREARAPR